jgi:hypothetical protein
LREKRTRGSSEQGLTTGTSQPSTNGRKQPLSLPVPMRQMYSHLHFEDEEMDTGKPGQHGSPPVTPGVGSDLE